jgi:hypothetical protein
MCPPCFRAHTRVRPYKTIERYIWDKTLGVNNNSGERDRDLFRNFS